MSTQCRAPWTMKEVENLEARQAHVMLHEYTCIHCSHELTPEKDGWFCESCGKITQTWAYSSDTEGMFRIMRNNVA